MTLCTGSNELALRELPSVTAFIEDEVFVGEEEESWLSMQDTKVSSPMGRVVFDSSDASAADVLGLLLGLLALKQLVTEQPRPLEEVQMSSWTGMDLGNALVPEGSAGGLS